MFKNRIFGTSIITLLAVLFCFIAVRVEQAAQQDPQTDKSTNKAANPQAPDSQSGVPQERWPIFLPKKTQPTAAQSSGGAAQEQKPGGATPTPKPQSPQSATPPATGKQSPMQQLRSQLSDQGEQDRLRIGTELVSVPVTVTDAYNRLVTGLDRQHFEVYEDKVKQEISFFSD